MKMNYSSTFVFTLLLKTIKYTSILAKLNFSCTLVYTLILKFTKSIRNKAILFILFIISLYSYTQNTLCTLILRKLYFFFARRAKFVCSGAAAPPPTTHPVPWDL